MNEVEIDQKNINYKLLSGKEAIILYKDKELKLTSRKPEVRKPLSTIRKT